LIHPKADGDWRVLADVRVDEEAAARPQDPVCLPQHRAQRLGRQVLEDVEGARFRERVVAERQLPQIADEQVHVAACLGREERRDIDPDRLRPPVPVPQERASAAAPQVHDEIVRARGQEVAEHVVADLRTEQRRRDPLVARVGVQRLVQVLRLLVEPRDGAQVEVLG
jgi:hypothetical protein